MVKKLGPKDKVPPLQRAVEGVMIRIHKESFTEQAALRASVVFHKKMHTWKLP